MVRQGIANPRVIEVTRCLSSSLRDVVKRGRTPEVVGDQKSLNEGSNPYAPPARMAE